MSVFDFSLQVAQPFYSVKLVYSTIFILIDYSLHTDTVQYYGIVKLVFFCILGGCWSKFLYKIMYVSPSYCFCLNQLSGISYVYSLLTKPLVYRYPGKL